MSAGTTCTHFFCKHISENIFTLLNSTKTLHRNQVVQQ